jgi:hypothetical protein
MKIFVGGVKQRYAQEMEKKFPEHTFEFAYEQEGPLRWRSKARRCQAHFVYQHRCNHTQITSLRYVGIRPYFTDKNAEMLAMIKEVIATGKTNNQFDGSFDARTIYP